ncbi:hypothetical protein JRQ81_011029 [Phrynocephalus forsythii]|uniref:Exosome complex component RRP41 n=1 Tax=Phrynocephalus forsythii TaxID=171643 RepID=A0A9Q1B4Q4_9SAUR|nr:hypothetical protein JRQ81_011029 [Phrynocephalus forsythii]
MAGLELLSEQGYRVDGRRAGELRQLRARLGVFAQADGSAYLEQGNTKALAVVYGPHEILQADGGNYCASVNAATLAVIDAGIPMRDYVCACSAGFVEDTALADLNYVEEAAGGPQLALALLPKSDQIALLEMNARLHEDHLERILEAASKACKDIYLVLDQVVREHLQEVTALLGK